MKDPGDIQEMLQDSGWERSKHREAKLTRQGIFRPGKEEIYVRRVQGEWVELKLPTGRWDSQLFLYVEPPPETRGERDKYTGTVLFENVESVADIDRVAEEMAAWRKSVRAPPKKRKVVEDFEWRGHKGAEGFAEWKKRVRTEISTVLRHQKRLVAQYEKHGWGTRPMPWVSQRKVIGEVLREHLPEGGLPRAAASREVTAILQAMEKEGLLEKIAKGDVDQQVHWEWLGEHGLAVNPKKPEEDLGRGDNPRPTNVGLVTRLKF